MSHVSDHFHIHQTQGHSYFLCRGDLGAERDDVKAGCGRGGCGGVMNGCDPAETREEEEEEEES